MGKAKAARKTKTHQEVKQEFRDAGITIRDWAKKHGFSASLVYTVLADERPATRGKSHAVAVALGLKPRLSQPRVG
jgi:gp16 family phage-associated protein